MLVGWRVANEQTIEQDERRSDCSSEVRLNYISKYTHLIVRENVNA